MLSSNNIIVNSLWIGKNLSMLELLTIKSFQHYGHKFQLWVYDEIETALPEGVILKDASEIIPREEVFSYKNYNQFGHGKGSYAGFSDIFRYKLLYELGGWWVDMDVTCLKPLNFSEDFVFRSHHDFPAVGNIMKCPPKSDLMKFCYEMAKQSINENNTNWNKPLEILNQGIRSCALSHYIKEISNPDRWDYVKKLLIKDIRINEDWYALHWMNEEWRKNKLDKNFFVRSSTLDKILRFHNLHFKKASLIENIFLTALIKLKLT